MMVNGSRRGRGVFRSSRSSSPAKAPHFYKIINYAVVQNGKLSIPRKFVRQYGEKLSNHVFLKVPTGAVWQVKLTNSEGHVWLHNGWKEFTEYYSLRYGHFLVFRYDGNSHFRVLIFDMSASEIEYPITASHGGQTNLNGDCQMPETEGIETGVPVQIKKEGDRGMPTAQAHLQSQIPDRRQKATADKKNTALQRAKVFESKNPFFVVYIQPSYICAKRNLHIPLDFAKKYFNGKQVSNVTLRVSDGRTWPAKCYCWTSNASCKLHWFSFVQDNNIEVGDVCLFELIKSIEPSLNVVIFRAAEY